MKNAFPWPLLDSINPRTLYDFLGFEKHVRQIREKRGAKVPEGWYKRPGYYVGICPPDKLFGPGTVTIPRFIEKPDYEFEIALIVGKEGRFTDEKTAAAFIQEHCYFTLMNDWSARDYQKLDMDMGLSVAHSKSIIGTSIGPKLVPASQFKFDDNGVPDIPMKLTINGAVRSESNYNTVYWSFPKILAFLGRENIGVWAGDIIGSGTVGSGCIAEFSAKVVDGKEVEPAKYPWLKDGDEIILEAEGIGALKNNIVIARA
ncbi:MAG: fumarylacetoacetate hydrolase family protein [Deltaproteobacteria bacterium]|nr:fumarylacetoacetate hydrolase family protein [Deltaproteobacteria bacterium]